MKIKIFVLLIGLIFCSAGLYFLNRNLDLINNGLKTVGEVVDIGRELDDEGDYMYYPIVKFADVVGDNHVISISSTKSNHIGYDVGDPIKLVYLEEDVNSVAINSIFWIYIFPTLFIMVGFLILLMGYYAKKPSSQNVSHYREYYS